MEDHSQTALTVVNQLTESGDVMWKFVHYQYKHRLHTLDIGRLQFSAGVVARGNNRITSQWMGFCYGSWLPKYKRDWAIHLSWLCFYGTICITTRFKEQSDD